MTRDAKKRYLESKRWRRIRSQILDRDMKCQYCGSLHNLQVHHIHYLNLGFEKLEDLVLLCESCHSQLHEEKGYSRQGIYEDSLLFDAGQPIRPYVPNYEELEYEFDANDLPQPIIFDGGDMEMMSLGKKLRPWMENNDIQGIRYCKGRYAHGFPRSLTESKFTLFNTGTVRLSGYSFETVPAPFFELLRASMTWRIHRLNLSCNQIKVLPDELGNNSSIKVLDLSDNLLKTLPSAITRMQGLEELILDYNNLENLPEELAFLPNLERISVKDNSLRNIPYSLQTKVSKS